MFWVINCSQMAILRVKTSKSANYRTRESVQLFINSHLRTAKFGIVDKYTIFKKRLF